MKLPINHKILLSAFMLLCIASVSIAQTNVIGNKSKSSGTNASVDIKKGGQVGIKVNTGKKPVQLLNLNFNITNTLGDSVRFKVNVYDLNGMPGKNLVTQDIISWIPKTGGAVHVDLTPYNVTVKGKVLLAIEWLDNKHQKPEFSAGLLNGGTFTKDTATSEWEKLPVVGIGLNAEVKK
jgi:hypothetical protein